MLCRSVLAELEAALPAAKRIAPPSGDAASVGSESVASSTESSAPTSTESTVSAPSTVSETASVGAPRDFSGHANGTTSAYNSVEKWVLAALRKLGHETTDIVLPSMEPNDELCSQIHATITEWHTNRTTARDAGVIARDAQLDKPPPQECLVKTRGWLLRYINQVRAEKHISALANDKWGRKLAGVKADARAVNKKSKELKAESGKLYHHKHDVAPTHQELMTMTYVGFSGDQRVHADILDSMEAGMAVALYLPTGARGSELKKMHLQSLGHEAIEETKSGLTFECLKLTAFETKSKQQHLNQILAHSNPWRCGVGLLGLSLLTRIKIYGAMPFRMQTDEHSWKIIGTSVGTLDDRIKEVFKVANVRRQHGDPVTYLGRHFGTRLLQHAGGSAEGGAARRGHTSGTTFNYSECPLPDLLKLAGNDSDKPFVPAHHQPDLYPLADAVLLILFPELDAEEKALEKRQQEVEAIRGNADKVRTEEQLNDRQKLLRSIRFTCRMALCCLVARPRTWKRWAILEDESTVWQRACDANHRVVTTLFAGSKDSIERMNSLALAVRRAEEAEIAGRLASPDQAITTQVVTAIAEMRAAAATREAEMFKQQEAQYRQLMSMVTQDGEAPSPPEPLPPPSAEAPPAAPPAASAATATASTGSRIKHARVAQDDVAHFSSWPNMGNALKYAKEELAPREQEEGAKWRISKREDGREDKSRDKQWRCYRSVAIAVGVLVRSGKSSEEAVDLIQERFESFYPMPHTSFLKAINQDIGKMRSSDADVIAREVLGC